MSEVVFELVGHDNPLGRYPAPVVPVGRLNERLIAVYPGTEEPRSINLEEDCQFVHHDGLVRETLRSFDYRQHRLFAISENNIVAYLAKYETDFFNALLKDKTFSQDNPFLRLSLAKATKLLELVKQEISSCVVKLSQDSPHFVDTWYESQVQILKEGFDFQETLLLPSRWQDLPITYLSGSALKISRDEYEAASKTPSQQTKNYTTASQLLDRVSVADYENDFARHKLLEQAKVILDSAYLEGSEKEGVTGAFIEVEKVRLKYLSQSFGQAETRFRELKEAFEATDQNELLAKALDYKKLIDEKERSSQKANIIPKQLIPKSNYGTGPHDFLIVGAGYAGSVLAERLARGSAKRVLICDKRPHIGGNAYDYYNDDGILVHKYGPHIFHTNSREVFEYLSQFTDWRSYQHRVLASVDGLLVPIPINLDTINKLYGLNLTSIQVEEFLKSLAEPREHVRTAEDVVVSKLGRELYEKFFRNYTRKQWGLDPSELDANVIPRVPTRTNRDDRYFTDAYQAMPLHGYTRMFENMLDHPNIKIMLNCDYREIEQEIPYREMIYTGPVDSYFNYRYGHLPYRSLEFKHETHPVPVFLPAPVINYPTEHLYTRVTEFKYLTGQEHAKTTIVYEFPQAEGDPYYPIPRKENAEIYAKYKALSDATPGVHFVGRLATYKYYNMDQIIAQALTTYAKISGKRRWSTNLALVKSGTTTRNLNRVLIFNEISDVSSAS